MDRFDLASLCEVGRCGAAWLKLSGAACASARAGVAGSAVAGIRSGVFGTFLAGMLVLAGCAAPPSATPPAEGLLHDAAFASAPSATHQGAATVFAMSPSMIEYLQNGAAASLRRSGMQKGLLEALYSKQQLQLEYDAERTRTAAEAFEARAGNCLSLAIMTAAFAKQLDLKVRFQSVDVASTWGRSGDLVLHNGHVNVSIGEALAAPRVLYGGADWLTIDFLPPPEIERAHVVVIEENRVVAMYMNNRSAEELAADRVDEAYWWARAAVLQDPAYADAFNTLGVVYRRRQQPLWAETAMRRTLTLDGDNINALSNLATLLAQQGRASEAAEVSAQLKRLQPHAPFENFDRGMAALRVGDYRLARDLLEKEVGRTNGNHEVHLGLAIAYLKLGDARTAARHLEMARDNSTTRQQQAIYAAKLAHLKTLVQ